MTGSGNLVPSGTPSSFMLKTGVPIIVLGEDPLTGKSTACLYSMNATVTLSLLMTLRMLCDSEADASNSFLILLLDESLVPVNHLC